ncbi:hypothetical protein [Desulfurococcus mucosus]|uniref:Uncharacterized protein n=1 Tax=Desulfurococcus mucosus (strain ATCC 35584 / DSM 2162 / JCM 9187 / O7/1) TaxID=765177 RepID=E8R6Z9_DESM0|nr:hypothetical protein [Desulfurococcus mucosus]ADV64432.1 hypothetical protein Desmu_0113 [Desulfurococcus mucosus DSM 2162]
MGSGDEERYLAVRGLQPLVHEGLFPSRDNQMGGSLTTPTAPQMTDVAPNKCGEPVNPLGESSPFRAERRSEGPQHGGIQPY